MHKVALSNSVTLYIQDVRKQVILGWLELSLNAVLFTFKLSIVACSCVIDHMMAHRQTHR